MSTPPEENRSQLEEEISSRPHEEEGEEEAREEEGTLVERIDDPATATLMHELNLQSLANMFFMSQMPVARHRRSRASRRIKRASQTHRSLLMPHIRLFNVNDVFLRQALPTNLTLVQVPFQFLIIDNQNDDLRLEWPDENGPLPLTREEINQLTSLSSEHEP